MAINLVIKSARDKNNYNTKQRVNYYYYYYCDFLTLKLLIDVLFT